MYLLHPVRCASALISVASAFYSGAGVIAGVATKGKSLKELLSAIFTLHGASALAAWGLDSCSQWTIDP
jgi:hypothetical protein